VDISERKREKEILLAAHRELKQNTEELKQFNDEMKEFTYVTSHHLQEPLRKIQTYTNLLLQREQSKLSEEGKEYLGKIFASCELARDRVNDLKLFTFLNIREKTKVPVNLQLLLKRIIDELDVLILLEKAKIEMHSELPVIQGDPILIGKLFLNLLSNAIKFHKPNVPPVIKVRHTLIPGSEKDECEKVEIEFEDNGIGFDQKFQDEIFHLFRKNVESEGQGIGLAISRKICNLHGGNLTASSIDGTGSKFIAMLNCK
jgi:light-regulated signal transduction histidine kinase (bacteriophytochrome)